MNLFWIFPRWAEGEAARGVSSHGEIETMRSFCGSGCRPAGMMLGMNPLRPGDSRTLTVVLSESDWRALRNVEPDAVGWLHERIQERLGRPESRIKPAGRPSGAPSSGAGWGEDLY